MTWQAILAGALASVLMTCAASADVRITNDPGGEVAAYVQKFQQMRETGERIVIDGPCLSACTLLTGIVPRDHVCVTSRAVLGFSPIRWNGVGSQPPPMLPITDAL